MENPDASADPVENVQVPPLLYKYGSWRSTFHKRLITHREIFFARPTQLNDPYDCAVNLRYDLMSPNQQFAIQMREIPLELPRIDASQVEQLARQRVEQKWFSSPERRAQADAIQQELRDRFTGVFCLAKDYDILPMWAHYAANHSGFCVGYNGSVLIESVKTYQDGTRFIIDCNAVEYVPEYPLLNPGDLVDDRDYFMKPLCVKSGQWSYECEWRFVFMGEPPDSVEELGVRRLEKDMRRLVLPVEAYKHLILGGRMRKNDREQVIRKARKALGSSIPIFQAEKKEGKFGLELVRLA